jgi:hypothetical protein
MEMKSSRFGKVENRKFQLSVAVDCEIWHLVLGEKTWTFH